MKLPGRLQRFAGVLRFFGLWAGISGGYAAMGSTCPCCGRPGCPVGLGIAAFFGGLGSFIILKGRSLVARLFKRNRAGKNSD